MRFTLCAQSKLLTRLDWRKCFKIKTENLSCGSHIDLVMIVGPDDSLFTICTTPKIFVEKTELLGKLKDAVVDYDFETDDFILSNR